MTAIAKLNREIHELENIQVDTVAAQKLLKDLIRVRKLERSLRERGFITTK